MSAAVKENLYAKYCAAKAAGNLHMAHDIASCEATLCEQRNNLKQAGIWRCALAVILSLQGRYALAEKQADYSAEIQSDPYERARALQVLATALFFESKSNDALTALGRAEEIVLSRRSDTFLSAIQSSVTALGYCLTGDVDRSLVKWMNSAGLFRSVGKLYDAAVSLNSLGFELAKQRRLDEAEGNLMSALELIAKQPHLPTRAAIYDSVGYVKILQKHYSEAERYLNDSAKMFLKFPDKAQLVGTFNHLSELHERKRDWKLARSYAERALTLATETQLQHLCSDAMRRLSSIVASPRASRDRRVCFHGIIYASDLMHTLIAKLKNVAPTDVPVLLLGETGTGKDLLARAIHLESKRSAHPFVPFNCSALSPELIESRLFGHRKGAFTGASADQQGVIRQAEGGTVFLDEIGELTLEAQGALLRFLDSGEIQIVGASRPVKSNVRVVCATNRDLRADAEAGRFRRDLYYRLSVATLFIPPLCQRSEDLKELVRHFARVFSKEFGQPEPVFSREDMARLVKHGWPGNVRELESYIKRRILFGDVEIEQRDLSTPAPQVLRMTGEPASCESSARRQNSGNDATWRSLSRSEKCKRLNEALESTRGNVTMAARQLGISRKTAQRLRRESSD